MVLLLALTIVSAGQMVLAFNIEPAVWKSMTQPGKSFGYKAIQHNATSLLVSAPVEEVSLNRRGRVYRCQISACPAPPQTCSCTDLRIDAQNGVSMSLGLWMSKEVTSSSMANPKTVVCGPTIPKECEHLTLYGGMCFSIDKQFSVSGPVPPKLRDCPVNTGLDIAFLLDGSISVSFAEFQRMKDFVINLIEKFINKNTQIAVVQFSTHCEIEINFKDFNYYIKQNSWKQNTKGISQLRSLTYTAEAINKVMSELFVASAGHRPKAKKVLLVITDGASNGKQSLQDATDNAHRSNVTCYAIGVGKYKKYELDMIASEPNSKHVFTVNDFNALDGLKATLEENIAIEGTQTSGDSTHMEFAQEGFSAALVMDPGVHTEKYLMSAVGANEWKGIYQEYPSNGLNPVPWKIDQMEPDSYMGYTMAVAMRRGNRYVVLGAPRYKHRGQVVVHHQYQTQKLKSGQIGSYFGAEVCVVDLDGDSNTDLILASAPMHTEGDTEGKVLVYKFTEEFFRTKETSPSVSLLGVKGQRGRFGSSLASLADLNGDGIRDVAVGAPLEDNGQGSVYIFNGRKGGINPTYSQRIVGSSVRSGLRFFGLTVAQSALDQSGDGLPDIAVGSKGAVLLLRSRPVVSIETSVTFAPSQIPTTISGCANPIQITASVCFVMKKANSNIFIDLQATLNYSLKLDYTRPRSRAHFTPNERQKNFQSRISLQQNCFKHPFFVQCSPEDALNPVDVQVAFSFDGAPIQAADQLAPQLDTRSSHVTDHKLKFEIDCGTDNICEDNLRVDFNFSGPSIIEVGIVQEMSVTVMVENKGENSYDTRVFLFYHHGLSYRTFSKSQGRVECSSLDSSDDDALGKTECIINRPILRANDKVVFVVEYGIDGNSHFEDKITIQAEASSGNDKHAPDSELLRSRSIGVKYSIYVILKRLESTTNYINFTANNNNLQKPVVQTMEVTNSLRGLNLTVVIHVPIRLQGKDIWTDVGSLNLQGCTRGRERTPINTDLQQIFKDNKEPNVNCSFATYVEFRCNTHMMRGDRELYTISGNVSSGWIEKTGRRSAMFHLVSSATLEYDNNKYIYYSSDSSRLPPVVEIETQVEVYEEPDLTKVIIGGVAGGLILLALITAALVMSGFFKNEYQQKLLEAEE